MTYPWTAILFAALCAGALTTPADVHAQKTYTFTAETEIPDDETGRLPARAIFDDQMLLNGYAEKYRDIAKDTLIEMIKDDTLTSYRSASAIKVFKEKYSEEVFSIEKKNIEKILLRRLQGSDSPFIQIEIMHTLCRMDRYRYFNALVPALIKKLGHYNETVSAIAFDYLSQIIESSTNRQQDARVVFNTLRKIFFIARKEYEDVVEPDVQLTNQLKLLRWSIKALGNDQLKKLPIEVINLL